MDKKHVVHCLNCARKISDSLSNFVILEEYIKSELLETYDKFVLHVPTAPSTPNINNNTNNNINNSTPNLSSVTSNNTSTPTISTPNSTTNTTT